MHLDLPTTLIIIPIGLSFYSLQTLGYVIDVYRKTTSPCTHFVEFALFASFFPQVLAGPIERAGNMLVQFESPRRITADHIHIGIFLILTGYFKKVVVADSLALLTTEIFNHHTNYSGMDFVIGIFAFSIQIYADFSGYSDIARGLAKLMGFNLTINFKLPYFARNPSDFWMRWHVSLSNWLRDYIFLPLYYHSTRKLDQRGKSGKSTQILGYVMATTVTMLIAGAWHGSGWIFILWGMFHAILLIVHRLYRVRFKHPLRIHAHFPSLIDLLSTLSMFLLVSAGWLLFRIESIEQLVYVIHHLDDGVSVYTTAFIWNLVFFVFPLVVIEIPEHVTGKLLIWTRINMLSRILFYSLLMVWIIIFGVRESMEFIYFKF